MLGGRKPPHDTFETLSLDSFSSGSETSPSLAATLQQVSSTFVFATFPKRLFIEIFLIVCNFFYLYVTVKFCFNLTK
jgi:hypothetical protein